MRGSPLIRTCVVLALLLLAALPLWRLTRSHGAPVATVAPEIAANEPAKKLSVHLKFVHAPRSFRLLYLGKTLWNPSVNGAESFKTELGIPFPKEGIDLELKAQWPEGTPETAVRLDVQTPEGASLHKTVWGKGAIDEILTFP
ncbi:MAG: hypothetical protein PHD76_06650 [Methylacidiphilales bacterium]|nr:hypothetical protein [Candidatus Methylacidiphilales bacterium]